MRVHVRRHVCGSLKTADRSWLFLPLSRSWELNSGCHGGKSFYQPNYFTRPPNILSSGPQTMPKKSHRQAAIFVPGKGALRNHTMDLPRAKCDCILGLGPPCHRHQTPTGAFWGNLFLQPPGNLGVATPGCGFTEAVPLSLGTLWCVRNVSPVTLQSYPDHVTRVHACDFR